MITLADLRLGEMCSQREGVSKKRVKKSYHSLDALCNKNNLTQEHRIKPASSRRSKLALMACFSIWIFANLLQQTTLCEGIEAPFQIVKFGALFVCVCIELVGGNRYSYSEIAVVVAIIVIGIGAYFAQNSSLFQAAILIFCCRNIEVDTLLRVFLVSVISITTLVAFLSVFGLIDSGNLSAYSSRQERFSLGFVWPSRLPTLLFVCFIAYICLKRDTITIFALAMCMVINVFVFTLTNSRTPFIFSTLLLILVICKTIGLNIKLVGHIKWGFWVCCLIPACMLIAVSTALLFNSNDAFFVKLDDVLAHRLIYSKIGLNNAHISLFGMSLFANPVNVIHMVDGFFDSGYLVLLFGFGLFSCFIEIVCIFVMIIAAFKLKDFYWEVSLIMFLLFSLFYAQMMTNLVYNCLMLMIPFGIQVLFKLQKGMESKNGFHQWKLS